MLSGGFLAVSSEIKLKLRLAAVGNRRRVCAHQHLPFALPETRKQLQSQKIGHPTNVENVRTGNLKSTASTYNTIRYQLRRAVFRRQRPAGVS